MLWPMYSTIYRAPALALAVLLASCGGVPAGAQRAQRLLDQGEYEAAEQAAEVELARFRKHPTLWKIKIRAAMGRGDNAAALAYYRQWRDLRGSDDSSALRAMALTVLWQGLRVPSPSTNAEVIGIIERFELEAFARDVGERVTDDTDLIAAAAAVALLRSHPAAPRAAFDLLTSDDPKARALVVAGIGRKVGKRAREDLLPLLGDRDPGVRRAAIAAIASFKDAADTFALARIARKDVDGPVRAAAMSALRKRSDPKITETARSGLGDSYLGVRLAALALLVDQRGNQSHPRLARLAAGDDLFLALRAAILLEKRTGESIEAPLSKALASEASSLRVAAVRAIAEILPRDRALSLLGVRMADPRIEVRVAAARALLRWGLRERAVPVFVAALAAASVRVRLSGARELARLRDVRGLEALSVLARSASATTRAAAVRGHSAAGRPSDGMVAALADESIAVRIAAAETLLSLLHD